tara:strand:+ start:2026 stop:2418 length:393 start_codon:yes stop_codon:yes gene_type:complete
MEILFQSADPIPSHALVALLAVILGGLQLSRAKGTAQHRLLGWIWVALMTYVAASSFFISEIKLWGDFSPIHLLSGWTLISLVVATYHARRGNIRQHKIWMVLLYALALLLTGLFTLWPGRVMHGILFGA